MKRDLEGVGEGRMAVGVGEWRRFVETGLQGLSGEK